MYFEYPEQIFTPASEQRGDGRMHDVAIAGAGPVGLCLALALARQGIASVVFEPRGTIHYGSRAICISQRSIDILELLGVSERFLDKAYAWDSGTTYYRDKVVLRFEMPRGEDRQHPPMINIQQCYIEQFLYEAALKTGLVEVRWHSKIIGLEEQGDHVTLEVDTHQGAYIAGARYLVACDGAHSFVRHALALELKGTSYEGRYVIADIHMEHVREGRRVWFDPPSNPNSTVVMHCQPDNIIRVDYQLRDDEDPAKEGTPNRVLPRVKAHLNWIGEKRPWELVWVSIYKAHSRTLDHYVHGRILFAGDAAHLVPIFGVRGLNSGFEDANNLAWRLAAVIWKQSSPQLLETYSQERRAAAVENMCEAEKSAAFMTPPSRADRLLRDAILSLAISEEFVRPLINPRQVTPTPYPVKEKTQLTDGAIGPGHPCPNVSLKTAGGRLRASLFSRLVSDFTVLLLGPDEKALSALDVSSLPFDQCLIVRTVSNDGTDALLDEQGVCFRTFGIEDLGAVLIRPDGYIANIWRARSATELEGTICGQLFHQKEVVTA